MKSRPLTTIYHQNGTGKVKFISGMKRTGEVNKATTTGQCHRILLYSKPIAIFYVFICKFYNIHCIPQDFPNYFSILQG